MSLAQRMSDYLVAECKVPEPERQYFLLGVSGGRDSVVMACLFAELGYTFGIAHCNFQLRGAESTRDAGFVRDLAQKLDCPFFVAAFDTEKKARERGASVQVVARELRYEWFEQVCQKENFSLIATAHHLTDAIETQLHHLVRGAGLKGLLGIPSRNGRVIRPLLFAKGSELNDYQKEKKINYREDSSNAELKYTRNYIRHRILPLLAKLNPSVIDALGETIQRLKESAWLMDQTLEKIKGSAQNTGQGRLHYELDLLKAYAPALPTVLFELLSPYGLNATQANNLASAILQQKTGKIFETPYYDIATTSDTLEVVPAGNRKKIDIEIRISEGEKKVAFPAGALRFTLLDTPPSKLSSDPAVAYFDPSALAFPLWLRKWRAGDKFQPYGMDGQHQKLQDFFSNNKFSKADKSDAWLLADANGTIAWIIGHRNSHFHRVRRGNAKCWKVEWLRS